MPQLLFIVGLEATLSITTVEAALRGKCIDYPKLDLFEQSTTIIIFQFAPTATLA